MSCHFLCCHGRSTMHAAWHVVLFVDAHHHRLDHSDGNYIGACRAIKVGNKLPCCSKPFTYMTGPNGCDLPVSSTIFFPPGTSVMHVSTAESSLARFMRGVCVVCGERDSRTLYPSSLRTSPHPPYPPYPSRSLPFTTTDDLTLSGQRNRPSSPDQPPSLSPLYRSSYHPKHANLCTRYSSRVY